VLLPLWASTTTSSFPQYDGRHLVVLVIGLRVRALKEEAVPVYVVVTAGRVVVVALETADVLSDSHIADLTYRQETIHGNLKTRPPVFLFIRLSTLLRCGTVVSWIRKSHSTSITLFSSLAWVLATATLLS
jgi:hypothetical protein